MSRDTTMLPYNMHIACACAILNAATTTTMVAGLRHHHHHHQQQQHRRRRKPTRSMYTVRHKNTKQIFHHNLKKSDSIAISFGKNIPDTTGYQMSV